MTDRALINLLSERVAAGYALPGEKAQLANLLRRTRAVTDKPGGQCKPAKVEGKRWGKKKEPDPGTVFFVDHTRFS